MDNGEPVLTTDLLIRAYAAGIFPMASDANAPDLHWFDPKVRAIIPLNEGFCVPRRLARTIRKRPFEISLNNSFADVIKACAAPASGRTTTWINKEILSLYSALNKNGNAYSVEVWHEELLVGGLYGVSLGGAFFGESMFSRMRDASKIALVYLVALLREAGVILLDTQFMTKHLAQFGAFEMQRAEYHRLLHKALEHPAKKLSAIDLSIWHQLVEASLQPITQTS